MDRKSTLYWINPFTDEYLHAEILSVYIDRFSDGLKEQGCKVASFFAGHFQGHEWTENYLRKQK